jgi:hypothetical protein
VGVNTSGSEVDRAHPILDAIAGFRQAVNRLIDEHKAGLLHRVSEPEADHFVDAVVPRPSAMDAMAMPRSELPVAPRAWSPPQPNPKPALEAALPTPATEPGSMSHPDDPRQRLDALAKLLDRRRKPGGASMTDAPSPSGDDKDG